MTDFLTLLAVCNTVVSEQATSNNNNTSKQLIYKASSPDELSLVVGAKQCGMHLLGREHDRVQVANMVTRQKH